tara:strand:+ start:1557 stop:1928 length:372 start_codon:yes stop_codon:yes gene_type:complete
MARIRAKIDNKQSTWTANMRPRVGSSIVYNGFYWTNVTGVNSIPGVANDWVKSGALQDGTYLLWNGYRLYKDEGNSQIYPEAGEEIKGRGNGTLFSGEIIHATAKIDNPTLTDADFNLLNSYP